MCAPSRSQRWSLLREKVRAFERGLIWGLDDLHCRSVLLRGALCKSDWKSFDVSVIKILRNAGNTRSLNQQPENRFFITKNLLLIQTFSFWADGSSDSYSGVWTTCSDTRRSPRCFSLLALAKDSRLDIHLPDSPQSFQMHLVAFMSN